MSDFPRSKFGFINDTKDHRAEEMGFGKHMQYPMLKGPTGICWIVDNGYSKSARSLCDVHRKEAFKAALASKNWSYARYLGINLDPRLMNRNGEFNGVFKKILSKTRRQLIAGIEPNIIVSTCRQSLIALGDLHVQIVRAIENGVILISDVRDLRTIDSEMLKQCLDDKKVPSTNERNPYRAIWNDVAYFHSIYTNKWMCQDDEQINNYHRILGINGAK
jgi:hypothetical protein